MKKFFILLLILTTLIFAKKWYEHDKSSTTHENDVIRYYDSTSLDSKIITIQDLELQFYTPDVVDSVNLNDDFLMFDSVGLNNKAVPFERVLRTLANDSTDIISMFGYCANPTTKVFTVADTWYVLEGTFTNEITNSFEGGTTGIVYKGIETQNLRASYMIGGIADDDAIFKIALVKNGTFNSTTGALETGSVLSGSGGGAEAVVIAGSKGFVNIRGFWAGRVEPDDELTIVYSCDEAGTELDPIGS